MSTLCSVHTTLFHIKSLLAVHVYLLLTQSNYVCLPCHAVPCHSLEAHRRSMFRYFQVNLNNNQCVFWLHTRFLINIIHFVRVCMCVFGPHTCCIHGMWKCTHSVNEEIVQCAILFFRTYTTQLALNWSARACVLNACHILFYRFSWFNTKLIYLNI